jgi:hypothetical protein
MISYDIFYLYEIIQFKSKTHFSNPSRHQSKLGLDWPTFVESFLNGSNIFRTRGRCQEDSRNLKDLDLPIDLQSSQSFDFRDKDLLRKAKSKESQTSTSCLELLCEREEKTN